MKSLVIVAALVGASVAHAWGISLDTLSDLMAQDTLNRMESARQEAARDRATETKGASKSPGPSPLNTGNWLYGERFDKERGIAFLAAQQGVGDGYEDRKWYFKRMLLTFNKEVPKKYGLPINNLATAVTTLVAGGYAAYVDRPFDDAWVKPLYGQIERAMLKSEKFASMDYSEKGYLYQVLVGMGMQLQVQQAQSTDAAGRSQLRSAGAEVLTSLLRVPPERIRIGTTGLEVR